MLVCGDVELRQTDRRLASLLVTAAQAGVEDHGVQELDRMADPAAGITGR